MEDPDIELFKVWPPQQNQELFTRIVRDGREELRKHYRAYFYAKRDQIYDYSTTPRMLAAYGYFFDRIRDAVERDALQEELIEPETGDAMLLLTSRVSLEMVQKAAMLGVTVVVAVSAPTRLAVETAEAAGLTLVAVARADGFEVFSHPGRIAWDD